MRRAPRARANSLPSSKSQLQADTPSDIQSRPATPRGSRYGTLAGRITPDTSRKFSDVVRVPSAPSRADEETPDSERCSSVYPVASNASETLVNTIPGVINTRIHITFTPTVNYEFPSGDERPLIASSISVSEMQKDDDGCIEKWSLTTRDRPACVARTTSSETTSCSEVPSNSMKGKRPHPCNWDAISGMSDGIDVDGQRPALASWKAAQKLARASSEDVSRADAATHLSKPAEPSQTHVETNWGEAKVTTKGETRKVNPKKNENPVRVIVDNVVARRASRHRRRPTPRAMEPVKQIDPTAFKRRLGRKGKRTRNKHWRSSSDDESSDSSGSSNDSSSSDTSSSSKSARADETSTSDSDNGDSPSGSESDPSVRQRRVMKALTHRQHRPPGQVGVIANARAVRGDVDTSPNGPRESRIERKERLTDA